MKYYVGLDVHCKQTVYVLQNDEGRVLKEGSIPTTVEGLGQLVKELKLPKDTPIGLETGAQANWVAQQLGARSMQPFVINAKEVRQKARRLGQKTDRRDAFEICDGLRREIYISIVWVPGEGIERLRKILSRRRHFVRIATRQITAVKFLLRSCGCAALTRRIEDSPITMAAFSGWLAPEYGMLAPAFRESRGDALA